jgi:predicted nucleic acid-binding protein
MVVVSDATPLIALAKINHLALLADLFGSVVVPQSVYDEVVTNAPNRPGAAEVAKADWIHVQSPDDQTKVAYLRIDLDPGEAEALVLAEELSADWTLLDETKARLAAELIGLRYIGTIGLLLTAKQKGKIMALRPLLDELCAKKFYLSKSVCRAVLKHAGE